MTHRALQVYFPLPVVKTLLLLSLPCFANNPPSTTPADGYVDPARKIETGVQWGRLLRQSSMLAGIQHGFRLATEPGTRAGMRGPAFGGYFDSVRNLRGWSDGDPFYVNYVGHPMQGSVASFLWIQNDTRYRQAEFGRGAYYWKSRLRAMAFSFAYSEQFEIGPFSEASIGKIQKQPPQIGFVDHVVTPVLGLGWTVAEDALDKHVLRRIENSQVNPWLKMLARGGLNPARSFANVLRWEAPWYRDTRTGVFSGSRAMPNPWEPREPRTEPPRDFGVAKFEFAATGQSLHLGSDPCAGAGGTAAFRITDSLQAVADVAGCKAVEGDRVANGDAVAFMGGPRWTPAPAKRWSPYAMVLLGGVKVTEERTVAGRPETTEASGFAIAAGGGLDLRLHRALALRVADLRYRRSWLPNGEGFRDLGGMQFSAGFVLRAGTW